MGSSSIRREILLALGGGAALLLIGCGGGGGSSDHKGAAGKVDIGPAPADLYERALKEGQVVIYASLSSDTTTSSFARAFNEAFPGITVKFVTGSASEVSARYQSEAQAGVPARYADPGTQRLLDSAGVRLVAPTQYMDRWRLDTRGVHTIDNSAARRALGLPQGS